MNKEIRSGCIGFRNDGSGCIRSDCFDKGGRNGDGTGPIPIVGVKNISTIGKYGTW